MNVVLVSPSRAVASLAAWTLLLTVPLTAACSRSNAAIGRAPAVPVVTGQARQQQVSDELRTVGQVEAWSTVSLRSQVAGTVTAVSFREGTDVREGDLLFSIDPRPFESALRQAEATLARDRAQLVNTRAQRKRAEELVGQGILSQADLDVRQATDDAQAAQVKADEAAVETARLNLSWCSIRAPMDGRTGAVLVFAGNTVSPNGNPLVVLTQTRPVKVSFAVPESRLVAVRAAAAGRSALAVEATPTGSDAAASGAVQPARGEMSFLDNEVDRTTGTIRLKARFDNQDRRLWPGEFVEVRLVLGTRPNAVVVPSAAVQPGQNGPYVYVVKSDSTVETRLVRSLEYPGNVAVVESGLTAGERVVVDGHLRLVPGAKIVERPEPGAAGPAAAPAGGRS